MKTIKDVVWKQSNWIFCLSMVLVLLTGRSVYAEEPKAVFPEDFEQVALQGFGDRHNSWAWSMQWWNGKLYVGTNRCWRCVAQAARVLSFPFLFDYPPDDPDLECAEDAADLPLQAEIWRYDPAEDFWELVFRSPNDVLISESPDKMVARDIGFRCMTLFLEPDGTEAFYVGGVNSKPIHPGVPAPRLLRSTDGNNFSIVPHNPGTVLGDISEDLASFRSLLSFKEKLYVNATDLLGNRGVVLEAADPSGGNDNFRQITPPDVNAFSIAMFNEYLYIALKDPAGYRILKTDAKGEMPYSFTTVITEGAYVDPPSNLVLQMHVYKDKLYVGTNMPAELIRINPDDSWDLVVGKKRMTPVGYKYPLSGLRAGFGKIRNYHIWQMQEHDGVLYVGTADGSTIWKESPLGNSLAPEMGFDLYYSTDGANFFKITDNGLNDKFNTGLRTLSSTPFGLFIGVTNPYYGLQIWQMVKKH